MIFALRTPTALAALALFGALGSVAHAQSFVDELQVTTSSWTAQVGLTSFTTPMPIVAVADQGSSYANDASTLSTELASGGSVTTTSIETFLDSSNVSKIYVGYLSEAGSSSTIQDVVLGFKDKSLGSSGEQVLALISDPTLVSDFVSVFDSPPAGTAVVGFTPSAADTLQANGSLQAFNAYLQSSSGATIPTSTYNISVLAVPEVSSSVLLLAGLGVLAALARKGRQGSTRRPPALP